MQKKCVIMPQQRIKSHKVFLRSGSLLKMDLRSLQDSWALKNFKSFTQPTQIGCFLPQYHMSCSFIFGILRIQKWLNTWCSFSVFLRKEPKMMSFLHHLLRFDNMRSKQEFFYVLSWDLVKCICKQASFSCLVFFPVVFCHISRSKVRE